MEYPLLALLGIFIGNFLFYRTRLGNLVRFSIRMAFYEKPEPTSKDSWFDVIGRTVFMFFVLFVVQGLSTNL